MKGYLKYILIGLLFSNILILIYVRVIGVSFELTSLIETDPVRYVHQAKQILDDGRLPDIERLRSSPLGVRTNRQLTFYPYVVAFVYRLVSIANTTLSFTTTAVGDG